jgi:glutathionylspermidine synthase
VEQERQQIAHQQAVENEKALKEHLASQRREMLERIPQWRDDERRDAERVKVIQYARNVGFSEEEVSSASDARAIELLYKAMQWDNLQKKKPDAKKRAKQAPKMAKAGTPKTKSQVASRSRQEAMNRLNKERSVDAAVQYLMGNKT